MIRRKFLTIGAAGFMAGMYVAGELLRPRRETDKLGKLSLETLTPKRFGNWQAMPEGLIQVDLTTVRKGGDPTKGPMPTYDEVLSRSYKNQDGNVVMLALAYGRKQSQELRIHRPELCYAAQGFVVKDLGINYVSIDSSRNIPVRRLLTDNKGRIEPVSYWIRIGEIFTTTPWQTRGEVLKQGLQGVVPDGILVRVSTIINNDAQSPAAFELQEHFLSDLVKHMASDGRQVLAAMS